MRYILILIGILCVYGGILLFWYAEHPSGTLESDLIAPTDAADLDTLEAVPPKHTETEYTDPEAYYQIIIDNNIFRPLNWEPQRRDPDYSLLGTIVAANGHCATAYIQDRKSETLHAVSVGQKIGTLTVKSIAPKQVALTQNGKTLLLSMRNNMFLNSRNTRSMSPRTATVVSRKNETHTITRNTEKQQNTPSEWKKHLQEKAAKIRAERKRLTEYLQQHQGMSGKQTLYDK